MFVNVVIISFIALFAVFYELTTNCLSVPLFEALINNAAKDILSYVSWQALHIFLMEISIYGIDRYYGLCIFNILRKHRFTL